MTEVEWNASTDPVAMLDWLAQHHKPSDRKLRLVACHLTKLSRVEEARRLAARIEEMCDDPEAMFPTNTGGIQLFCEDRNIVRGLRGIIGGANAVQNERYTPAIAAHILRDIINPFRPVTLPVGEKVLCPRCSDRKDWHDAVTGDGRCFDCQGQGGFYGPSPVLTPLVRSLAEAAYQERNPDGTLNQDRLLVLSDALIDAGLPEWVECEGMCSEYSPPGKYATDGLGLQWWDCPDCHGTGRQPHPLLAHLRGPGPHYRGCFAIDLLTGRG